MRSALACIGFIVAMTALAALLLILAGCASPEAAGAPAGVTYPLAEYSPEFSHRLALALRTAPPEVQEVVTDYVKLRCMIKPELPICPDLRK